MERRFNPQIRKLTRLVLEIPPEVPLPECSWPKRSEECSKEKATLIDSRLTSRQERYEVRSLDERKECAIGPEILSALKNPVHLKKVSEMLADIEVQAGTLTPNSKPGFMKELTTLVEGDISTRSQTMIYYLIYVVIAFFLLGYQTTKPPIPDPLPVVGNSVVFTILNILPLVSIYYLHSVFIDRVRTGSYVHVIPLALLVSYSLYTSIVHQGTVSWLKKYLLAITLLIALVCSVYLVMSFRGVYSDCYKVQRNVDEVPLTPLYLVAVGGLIIPIGLILVIYLAL